MDRSTTGARDLPPDLLSCVEFHGHLCPGLIYGYRVAKEAKKLLGATRSHDEEVVAACENTSCAVDALQIILGTTLGKGNLIIQDHGKNAYTVFSRPERKGFRFSRKTGYVYEGEQKNEFSALEKAMREKTAGEKEIRRQKELKARDLALKPFDQIFSTREVAFSPPPRAELAPSRACARCGEMTMESRMTRDQGQGLLCAPCAKKG
jgi:formylmethanofuran dehydrogenase subunit E